MKYTRYQDIPKFTRDGSWECDYSLDSAVEFIDELVERDGLDLDPDFQRAHVWTESQQVAWIEFILRGGKTGRVLYFNHPGWQKDYKTTDIGMVIVDGKQRLQAARRFINNDIKVFGSFKHEYKDSLRLQGSTLKINVNTLQTRREVITWYLEMNSGGTPHTSYEIERVRQLLLKAQQNDI